MQIIHEISSAEEKRVFFERNPKSLCKYRNWNVGDHKRIFTNNELFFSSPIRFNDPYDCSLPFKQHSENSDPLIIKQMVELTAPKIFPGITGPELEERCAKQVLLIQQNPESWFEMNYMYKPEDLHKTFGVISLTPHYDSYLMWSHYSNSHKGFCVEFDTRLLVESIHGQYQKVTYNETVPEFSIRDTRNDTLITKLIYTKSSIWSYEDEYRISRIYGADTKVQFNPKALIGVYFGCKMPSEQEVEIIEAATRLNPEVTFYKMNLDKKKFKLEKGKITLF